MNALARIDEPLILAANDDRPWPISGPDEGSLLVHVVNPMMPQLGARRLQHCEGLTVLEAIERAGWHLEPSTVLLRDGQLVRRVDWDLAPIGARELVVLITLPQGGKGGGSQIFAVVASIALALFAPQIGVALLGHELAGTVAFAGITWGSLATVGIVLAGSTLISALLPAPKPVPFTDSATQAPTSPTYSLSAASNQARLLDVIPERFGYQKIFPDLSAQPYFDFVNSNQELKEEFCIGMGEFEISEVGIANNPIWQDGDYTGTYPEIELLFMPPGTANTLFSNNVVTPEDVSNIELVGTGDPDYDWSGPFVLNPASSLAQQIDIDLSFPGGLFGVDTKGNLKSATGSFQVQVRGIDDVGTAISDWSTVIDETISLSQRDAVRTTYSAPLVPGRYEVRFERTNAKSADLNTSDTMAILAMRGYLPDAPARDDVTCIALKARSTKNLNGDSAQKFYVIATRKVPIWNGETETWSAPTATRSIAWAAAYLCQSDNGLRRSDDQVDLAKLAELDAIWTDRDDHFDGTFDTGDSAWTNLQAICRVGRTEPLRVGRYVTFNRDEPKIAPRAAFSPANMLAGSFNIDYVMFDANSTDALWIDFLDARNWQPNSVFCALPDSTTDPDDAPHISMLGITDRDHAWREGIFICATNRWRRRFPNFRTELEGRVCFRGDKIVVAHWLPGWGASASALYLEEHDDGDIITLSEPWNSPNEFNADTKLITLMTPDGRAYGPVTVTLIDDGDETGKAQVRLSETATVASGNYAGLAPRDWGIWDGDGLDKERPRVLYGTATQKALDALMVAMKPESGLTVLMAAVIDDARVHYVDGTIPPIEGDTPAPPDETNIPNVIPPDDLVITGLTVTEINQSGGVQVPPVIAITVQGAPSARVFDCRYKWNGADDYPLAVLTNLPRVFQFPDVVGKINIEVRAEGRSGFGDWFEFDFDAKGIPADPGADATITVSTDTAYDPGNPTTDWSWTSDPDAASYTVVLEATSAFGGTWINMGYSSVGDDTSYSVTNADVIAAFHTRFGVDPYDLRLGVIPFYPASGGGTLVYST